MGQLRGPGGSGMDAERSVQCSGGLFSPDAEQTNERKRGLCFDQGRQGNAGGADFARQIRNSRRCWGRKGWCCHRGPWSILPPSNRRSLHTGWEHAAPPHSCVVGAYYCLRTVTPAPATPPKDCPCLPSCRPSSSSSPCPASPAKSGRPSATWPCPSSSGTCRWTPAP